MTRPAIIFTTLFLTLTIQLKADSWTDPSWHEMIYNSDVIALVEYTSKGDFRAKAKPLTIYKGQLNTSEIWISGFSNRYGPIDKMRPGDQYIVFLNFYEPTEKTLKYWEKRLKEKPKLQSYIEALKSGNAYYVWTPTSGDLKVKGDKVQYDLLYTTNYRKSPFYQLNEFEKFLEATTKTNNTEFHRRTLKKIKSGASKENLAQHLMMLYLSGLNEYDPIYQTIADGDNTEANYALAQLLGQVKGEKSRDILIQLLDNQNSIVQGEAVRQLANLDPEFIGPILLARLNNAKEGGLYPSNIMDPVNNQINGGKLQIIETLGELKYKPAADALLPLLETENDYMFRLVIDVLLELDNKDFVPYINQHLQKRTKQLIFNICRIITANNLEECKPALMEFIANHNRNDKRTYEYAVSKHMGLANFDDQGTRDFLLKDFENLLKNNDSIPTRNLKSWIKEYIKVFKDLKLEEARPLIYESLKKWFGYTYDFVLHPELFQVKKNLEDSINTKALEVLSDFKIKEIHSIAFISNTNNYGVNFEPLYDFIILVELDYKSNSLSGDNKLWDQLRKVRSLLSSEFNIPIEQISSRNGSYITHVDDRFEADINHSPMSKFYDYAKEVPQIEDLQFLRVLRENGFAQDDDFDKRQLARTIKYLEEKLN